MAVKKRVILRELTQKHQSETIEVTDADELTLVLLAITSCDYTVELVLTQPHTRVTIVGFIAGSGQDHIKIYTVQDHQSPNTISDLHIKSVLRDQSFLDYAGFIRIAKAAQRSNAYQRNDNLLLSPKAKAETKPALEILANDVRCTHGATLGKIDPEQLFYLRSRGISHKRAEVLILEGFFQVLLDRIPDKGVQKQITKKIFPHVV